MALIYWLFAHHHFHYLLRIIRVIREKLSMESLSGRYRGSEALMNTLSGSLTFSNRFRRSFKWHHPFMSQSSSSIHGGKMSEWSSLGRGAETKQRRRSLRRSLPLNNNLQNRPLQSTRQTPCVVNSLLQKQPQSEAPVWYNGGQVDNLSDRHLLSSSGGDSKRC